MRATLLFYYCEEPQVVEEIVKILFTSGFYEFMAVRECKFGDSFLFIVDAAQKLDVLLGSFMEMQVYDLKD
eukprot:c6463_g1_i1 orf=402-614(-)